MKALSYAVGGAPTYGLLCGDRVYEAGTAFRARYPCCSCASPGARSGTGSARGAGDLLVTGTPGGVGAARTPPRWLRPGDTIEVDLGPVGCLRNTVSGS